MKLSRQLTLIALLAATAIQAPAQSPQSGDADRQLKALYESYADWTQREYGFFPDAKGENQPADYLPKVDPATQNARAAHLKSLLVQLDAIPAAQLSPDERVNAGVLRTILNAAISDARFREWEMPVNSDSNFWTYQLLPNFDLKNQATFRSLFRF